MLDLSYADARAIARDCLQLFLPPERLNVAQYATQHRLMDNAGGGHVGLYNADIAP